MPEKRKHGKKPLLPMEDETDSDETDFSEETDSNYLPQVHFNKLVSKKRLTFGQRSADWIAQWAGSWAFIIIIVIFISAWIILNLVAYSNHWDPWPFILLNLVLACLTAIQAPIILMSQNREAQKDRLRAQYDYTVDKKAEKEIQKVQKDLDLIKRKIGV